VPPDPATACALTKGIRTVDASGKSGAHRHHREIIKPARKNPQRVFHWRDENRQDSVNLSKLFRRIFSNSFTAQKQFDTSGKSRA
jgi:hypothetical protein